MRSLPAVGRLVILVAGLVVACGGPAVSENPTTAVDPRVSAVVSCQPFGSPDVPITVTFASGPVTAEVAQATAIAMLRSCAATPDENGVTVTIAELSSSVKAGVGGRMSPNAGQPVWVVDLDTTEGVKADQWHAYYSIEVNMATGLPTLMAIG